MFEFEEMSSGFHDGFLNKYADISGPIYDIFISDSMQDMLDIDIRTEVATVVGGTNEFSSMINDLPSYYDTEPICKDGDAWLGGPKWSAPNDYYADVGACVNPNSVMPIITSSLLNSPKESLNTNNLRAATSPASPRANKSHLTFSPNQIKMTSILQEKRLPTHLATSTLQNNRNNGVELIKKDLGNQMQQVTENETKFEKNNGILHSKGIISGTTNTIKLAPGIGGLTFANSVTYNKLKQQSSLSKPMSTLSQNGNLILKRDRDSSPLQNMATLNNGHYNGTHQTSKILPRTIASQKKNVPINITHQMTHSSHKVNHNNSNKNKIPINPEFPKPAYSYSCLIAMSLKNSRGGSLPVSEIYSFMCEHFPYFKTAPNGWKNSVRHNLSLNKCFEKIEKPATNGGQRKGCLWAMNPTKIAKMDDEVQKWSRKDPMAIRKAMVFPEHLEALERGEMKHGSLCDSDIELDGPSDVEESSDSEPEQESDEVTHEPIEEEEEQHHPQGRDFDIEVQDIYDAIDLEDDKDNLHRTLSQKAVMEITGNDYSSPKRARLNINYSITPAGAYEHYQLQSNKIQHQHIVNHHPQQQHQQHSNIQHHNRRKVQLVNRIA